MATFGPPIPGAPWARLPFYKRPASAWPAQVSQATPSAAKLRVPRVPGVDRRLAGFTEKVSAILNSLIDRGYIKASAGLEFLTLGGALEGDGSPTVNTDFSVGAVNGCCYIDTTADEAWICVDNSIGAAVWAGVGEAGPTGPAGPPGAQGASGPMMRYGNGAPDAALGGVGDVYIDLDALTLWWKN